MKLYFVRVCNLHSRCTLPHSHLLQEIPASPQSSQTTDEGATEDIVKNSRGNVLVETVAAGTLGLPIIAGPIYQDETYSDKLLLAVCPVI